MDPREKAVAYLKLRERRNEVDVLCSPFMTPIFQNKTFRIIHKPTSAQPLLQGFLSYLQLGVKLPFLFCFVGLLKVFCYCFCPASPIIANYRIFWIKM